MLWKGQVGAYWEHRAMNYLSEVYFRTMKTTAEKSYYATLSILCL